MNINLKQHKAVVCGASRGIGFAIAKALADCGASVLLVARDENQLKQNIEKLSGTGHSTFGADFSSQKDILALCDHLRNHPVDIVVNNTGGPAPGPVSGASLDEFNAALQMHLFASHQIMQAALPSMKAKQYGRFINVISTSVKIPINGLGVSNTTRGAMASWAKTLSNEVAADGITVNNILPGAVETDRLASIITNSAAKSGATEEEVSNKMKSAIPAGRFGQPEELGALAAFLASDLGAYITGVSIPVDGGRTGSL